MRTEWFPLVNEEGETIGKATRKECHSGSKLLHHVIHLHIFNKDGDLNDSDTFYADQLCKLWMSITQNKGYYYNCNNKMKSYKKLALGILVHNDHEKIDTLHSVVDYITKADQFIIEKTLKNNRTFGYSTRKLEKSKAGRPRRISSGSISV